jgi:hypothetical protein
MYSKAHISPETLIIELLKMPDVLVGVDACIQDKVPALSTIVPNYGR